MIGSGFGKDVEEGVKVELDRYYGLVLKPNMDLGDNANIFVNLGYVDIDIKATALGQSTSVSTDEFMWGVGIALNVNEELFGTVSFIDIDDADGLQISFGIRL
jgi:hypothetical protein